MPAHFIIALASFSFSFFMPLLVVGILGGLFQAATQIREASLLVVAKLCTIFLIVIIFGPKIFDVLTIYAKEIFGMIPNAIRS